MALPEPNNPLYAAVKAIANPWPPDDEDVVHQLADAWTTAGQAAGQAGGQAANSQQAVASSWQDGAGSTMSDGLTGVTTSMRQVGQGTAQLAATAERYAQVLTDVKTAITRTVSQALPAYLQAGNPTLPNGPAVQQQIATGVANNLTALVRSAASQLTGGMSTPPPANVQQWIQQAMQDLEAAGVPASELNANDIWTIIQHESGGNPNAINNWDSNAKAGHPSKGLMQTIDSTFNAYKLPGHDNIYNPVDNVIAGVRYAIARYGSIENVPGIKAVHAGRPYVGY